MKNLDLVNYNVVELKKEDLSNTNGGVITAAAVGGAIVCGAAVVGMMIVGAAVGYGIYRLVDWAISDN